MWVIDHCAGLDVLLGADFMIPAGVRLDMFYSNAKIPDEVSIPFIKTQAMKNGPEIHYEFEKTSVVEDSQCLDEEDEICGTNGHELSEKMPIAQAQDKNLYKKEEKL
ncbi:Eukaryotic/viral aspartic protease [Phytophthora megakarya]|uniref:Eukaryotic/viral aspartic protease n=1 Tax=Phytophthora megakarya TaxID=4795 RepID=A0A225WFZ1_9STRA|nr:Eukaryotic/viral aspartic protease [Phytophthora megakarya]